MKNIAWHVTFRRLARIVGKPRCRTISLLLLLAVGFTGVHNVTKKPPEGVNFRGGVYPADNLQFFADLTWFNHQNDRFTDQTIVLELTRRIEQAKRLIVMDMFLFNEFGRQPEHPAWVSQVTDSLIQAKKRFPTMRVVVVLDPINDVYGGMKSDIMERLADAGVEVVRTRLKPLRDSNWLYSSFWRVFVKPFANNDNNPWLKSPFSEDRVTLRSWLALLNFKANHRKLLVTDNGRDKLTAFIMSLNVHDASGFHSNVAIGFEGAAIRDVLSVENNLLALTNATPIDVSSWHNEQSRDERMNESKPTIQVLSGKKIRSELVKLLRGSRHGHSIDASLFYLADRDVLRNLIRAKSRGAVVRVLLDPNKQAFGLDKSGIPNQPVAHALTKAGIDVRWCNTRAEQCHSKLIIHRSPRNQMSVLLGSANMTRRNIGGFNYELSVMVRGNVADAALTDALHFFEDQWSNQERRYSVPYAVYADKRPRSYWLMKFMERTGMSSF